MTTRIIAMLAALTLLGGCASFMEPEPEPPQALPQPEFQSEPRARINGSIYQSGRDVRLFEDRTARRIGDLITVILEEETEASKDATTSVNKGSSLGFGVPQIGTHTIPGLGATVSADRDFSGSGASDQSNELTGMLTAFVVDRMSNGNLVIQGQKKLTLNRGDEYVTITGVVRPDDIRTDNSVSSTRVANARISYTGRGELADSNAMGWLTRVFTSVIWPF